MPDLDSQIRELLRKLTPEQLDAFADFAHALSQAALREKLSEIHQDQKQVP